MTEAKLGAIAGGVKSRGLFREAGRLPAGQRSRRDADLGAASGGHLMTTTAFFVTLSTVCDAFVQGRYGSTRGTPVASSARQKYLSYLPESLQSQALLPCACDRAKPT